MSNDSTIKQWILHTLTCKFREDEVRNKQAIYRSKTIGHGKTLATYRSKATSNKSLMLTAMSYFWGRQIDSLDFGAHLSSAFINFAKLTSLFFAANEFETSLAISISHPLVYFPDRSSQLHCMTSCFIQKQTVFFLRVFCSSNWKRSLFWHLLTLWTTINRLSKCGSSNHARSIKIFGFETLILSLVFHSSCLIYGIETKWQHDKKTKLIKLCLIMPTHT